MAAFGVDSGTTEGVGSDVGVTPGNVVTLELGDASTIRTSEPLRGLGFSSGAGLYTSVGAISGGLSFS